MRWQIRCSRSAGIDVQLRRNTQRVDEWRDFREPDTPDQLPTPMPPAAVIESPRPASEADVGTLHPVNQWNVVRTKAAVRARPVWGAFIVGYMEQNDEVFVLDWVGETEWLRVRAKLHGQSTTGYLREKALLRAIDRP